MYIFLKYGHGFIHRAAVTGVDLLLKRYSKVKDLCSKCAN